MNHFDMMMMMIFSPMTHVDQEPTLFISMLNNEYQLEKRMK